jgi:hypothetical protein
MTEGDERPPVFARWSGWYWLVMLFLAIQIIAYYYLMTSFS